MNYCTGVVNSAKICYSIHRQVDPPICCLLFEKGYYSTRYQVLYVSEIGAEHDLSVILALYPTSGSLVVLLLFGTSACNLLS
jgi:hypothetical protein